MTSRRSHLARCDGVEIHALVEPGSGSAEPPIVVLHGFTGSAESMEPAIASLRGARDIVSVDLVGHGRSEAPADVEHYTMESCVSQLAGLLDDLALGRPHLLGYSMGGRVALSFCARHPEGALSALTIGASPGIFDAEARAERVQADEALADRILAGGLEAFVEEWMAKPLFASQRRLGRGFLDSARSQRLGNRPEALALSLRGMGTGAMPPLELSASKVPLCFVAGGEDAKFSTLARAMSSRLEGASCEILPEAGHAAHLENPRAFGRVASHFFASAEARKIG